MYYKIIQRAVTSPVTRDDAKEHLQLYNDDSYNDYVDSLIVVAGEIVNSILGEPINEYSVEIYLDSFADTELSHENVTAIDSVVYIDVEGATQTVPTSAYVLDTNRRRPRLVFTDNSLTANLSPNYEYPITVEYEALLSDFGPDLEHAILIIIEDLFSQRGSTSDKPSHATMFSAEALLRRYRRVQW